jgi:MoaA/NifB/PqqE/SkfB family radical SAM enzyme
VEWFSHRDIDLKSITFSHLWFKDETIVQRHNKHYGTLFSVKQENLTGLDIGAITMDSVHDQIRTVRETYKHLPFSLLEQPRLTMDEARTYYARPTEEVFYNKCLAPWRNVSINPRGEVIVSPLCFDYSLGNIKQSSFPHIWNDTPIRRFRKHLRKAGMYPACTRCCMLFDSKPKYYKLKDLM